MVVAEIANLAITILREVKFGVENSTVGKTAPVHAPIGNRDNF